MKQKFSIFLMSFMLVMQIISNGLFIPMTASATDTVVSDDVTTEQLAKANEAAEAAEQAHLEKTQSFIADLFTSNEKIAIKQGIAEGQITTAKAYTEQLTELTDDETKASLQQDITLVEAFVAVNALFGDDNETIIKGLTQATIDAAQEKVNLVSEKSLVAGKKVLTTQIASATEQAEKASKKEVTKKAVTKDSKVVEKNEPIIKPTNEQVNETELITESIVKLVKLENTAGELKDSNGVVRIGDTLKLTYGIAFKSGVHNPGDTYTFTLPEQLTLDSGESQTGDVGSLATYSWAGKTITITLKDGVENSDNSSSKEDCQSNGVEEYPEDGGLLCGGLEVAVMVGSDSSKDTSQKITFDDKQGNKTYTVQIKPKADENKIVQKSAMPGVLDGTQFVDKSDGYGANAVRWTIDVNTALMDLSSLELTDVLEQPTWLGEITNFKVYNLNVDLDGNVTQGTEISTVTTPTNNTGWSYTLPEDGKAYRIVYETPITDTTRKEYKNTATLAGKSASATASIPRPDFIQKSFVSNEEQTTKNVEKIKKTNWKIVYNEGQQTIKAGNTLVDTMTNLHHYDENSIVIKDVTTGSTLKEADYSVVFNTNKKDTKGDGENKMTITFTNESSHEYEITYTSILNYDNIEVSKTITNKAVSNDVNGPKEDTATGPKYTENVLTKTQGTVNYKDQTIEWIIKVNNADYNMSSAEIIDTLGDGLTYVENSVESENKNGFTYTGQVLTFEGPFKPGQTIKYTTKFDPTETNFTNTATLSWGSNSDGNYPYTVTKNPSFDPPAYTQNNGYKNGNITGDADNGYVFNYQVGLNYNLKGIEAGTTLTDTLIGGHQVKEDSFEIVQMDISSSDGSNNVGKEAIPKKMLTKDDYEFEIIDEHDSGKTVDGLRGKQTFKITFKKGIPKEDTYQLRYTAYDTDNVYGATYRNTVESDAFTKPLIKDLAPENGGKELSKREGSANGRTNSFVIDINESQSHISNAVLTDALTFDTANKEFDKSFDNLFYVLDTFTLINLTTNKKEDLKDKLKIDAEKGTFTLSLGDIKDAYKLEYDVYYDGTDTVNYSNSAQLTFDEGASNAQNSDGEVKTEWKAAASNAWGKFTSVTRTNIFVKKVDAENGEPLVGVEFELYNADDFSKPIAKATTNESGVAVFEKMKLGISSSDPLLKSKYVIKETKAANGYVISDALKKGKEIGISKSNTNDNLPEAVTPYVLSNAKTAEACQKFDFAFENAVNENYKTAEFKLIKLDAEGNEVSTFEGIKLASDNKHFVTADGAELNPQLTIGKYKLVQTKTPAGYAPLNDKEFAFYDVDCAVPVNLAAPKSLDACTDLKITIDGVTDFKVIFTKSDDTTTTTKSDNGFVTVPDKATKYTKVTFVTNDYKNFDVNYTDLVFKEDCTAIVKVPTEDPTNPGESLACTEKTITIKDNPTEPFKVTFTKENEPVTVSSKNVDGTQTVVVPEKFWEGATAKVVVKGQKAIEISAEELFFADCKYVVELPTTNNCPQVEITVVDKDDLATNLNLENATITITDGNGDRQTVPVNTDGKAFVPVLEEGSYTITVNVPGFSTETKEITVTDCIADITDNKVVIEVDDMCTQFIFTFKDELDETFVTNATFKVIDADGNVVETVAKENKPSRKLEGLTIDPTTKKIVLENVPAGDYKLVTEHVPTGYKAIDEQTVNVGTSCEKEIEVDVTKNLACPQFDITVQDSDKQAITKNDNYKKFVANAQFELVDAKGNIVKSGDKELTALTINADGKVVLGETVVGSTELTVAAGEYTLKQINQVIGYKQITEKVVANGTDCNAVVTVSTTQGEPTACTKYSIQVVDKDGNALTDQTVGYEKYVTEATFKLVGSDNTEILDVKIGADGKLLIDDKDLTAPSYKLVQTNSVDGFYKLTADVTPKSDDCYAIVTINTIDNELQCSETQFIVGQGVPAGVTYVIESTDKKKSYTVKTVEENGKVVLKPAEGSTIPKVLPAGEYTVTTTKVPTGYAKSPVQTVAVTDENGKDCLVPVILTVVDCPDFTVTYQGPANSTAAFTLTGEGYSKEIAVKTDATGKAVYTLDAALKPGKYTLKQTSTPSGYRTAGDVTITVADDKCAAGITVTNTKVPVPPIVPPINPDKCENPTISVTPSTGDKPKAGTTVIVTVDGKTTVGKVDENGKVTFEGTPPTLEPGKKVTVKVDGYKETTTAISEKDCTTTIIITPNDKCENPTISVITPNGDKPEKGKKVTVTVDGKTTTGTVDENGKVTFEGTPPTLEPGKKVTVKVDGYKETTSEMNEKDCDTTIVITPNDKCENPTISVTPSTGDKPEKGTKVTVTTEDGKTTTGTVNEDGTITFEPGKEPTLEPGKKVTVEVEGYEPTTTTVNDKECNTTVTITPKNACDKFEVTVEDSDGDTINTVRVTIDGKTVKTTNGTYTFDQAVAPGTKVTFEKNGYKTQTVIVGDDCQVTVTLVKKDDSEEPGTDPEDPDNGGDGEDPNDGNTPDEEYPDGEYPDVDGDDNDNNNGNTGNNGNNGNDGNTGNNGNNGNNGNTGNDGNAGNNNNNAGNAGNNTPGNGNNNAANGTTGNHANTTGSSILPQTGEQVALYSLVGMLLIGAAFMLFRRNRRKA